MLTNTLFNLADLDRLETALSCYMGSGISETEQNKSKMLINKFEAAKEFGKKQNKTIFELNLKR